MKQAGESTSFVISKQSQTVLGRVTATLERGGTTVLVRDIPADVCENVRLEKAKSGAGRRS